VGTNTRTVAVIDPVAMAGPYGEEGVAMGFAMIAVLTQEFNSPYVAQTFRPDCYAEIYRHRSTADTIAFLRDRKVVAVVPGTQTALDLVDIIADALGVIGNPVANLRARMDKRVMKEHWTRAGIACAAFLESSDPRAIQEWAEARGYPVVLKPTTSTGASHVYVCADERDVMRAFAVITSSADVYDRRFHTVLAEEYVDGDEYFMNLLHDGSGSGELISFARYEKVQRDGHPSIYRNFRSLPLDDSQALESLPYIQAANAAVGVRYGINDTEYMLTSRGPRAIEINNRLPGASTPQMIQICSGLNTYRTNIQIFLGEYDSPAAYHFHRHYNVCCLINHTAGRVSGYAGLTEVRRLPSFDSARMIAEPGRHWPVTEDMASSWGLVRLVHEDADQLERDAEAVHALMRLIVD
jgi:biotin carboxylase